MSKLYGQIEPDTGASPAHRPANGQITVWAQTELGRLEITLFANGDAEVTRYAVRSRSVQVPGRTMMRGNVNDGLFWTPASIVIPE